MPQTANWSIPYYALSDPPNIPAITQAMAERIDALVSSGVQVVTSTAVVVAPIASQIVWDLSCMSLRQWTGTAWVAATTYATNQQATSGGTTSTGFVAALSAGAPCFCSFVAPASGAVLVHNSAWIINSATGGAACGFEVRTGSVAGGGSQIIAPSDASAIYNVGSSEVGTGRAIPVDSLTPGSVYNVRQMFHTTGSSTATFRNKGLTVTPL